MRKRCSRQGFTVAQRPTIKEEKSRPARVYWPIFFFLLLLTRRQSLRVSTRVIHSPAPTNFPPSRGAPSRLIISNKRSRRRNGRNPVLRRAVMNLIIFYGRGFRAGCRAIFPFLFEMII